MSASKPACTAGCSVFTRPSRHSGKPVISSTWVTGKPAAAIVADVLPVETIWTPAAVRAVASSASPLLSETLISARRIATLVTRSPAPDLPADLDSSAANRPALAHHPAEGLDNQSPLRDLDALVQSSLVVIFQDGDSGLGQDRAAVDARIDQDHAAPRHFHTVR